MDLVWRGGVVAAALAACAGGTAWGQAPTPAAPAAPNTPAATGDEPAPPKVAPEPANAPQPKTSEERNQEPPAIFAVTPAYDRSNWRLLFGLGGGWVNGDAFGGLLQSGYVDNTQLDVTYQPGALGLNLGVDWLGSSETHSGVTSHYTSTEWRLALTYAPLPQKGWQVIPYLGVLRALHRIALDDGYVTRTNRSDNYGALGGIDFATPDAGGLRLVLRLEYAYQRMKFAEFSFDHKLVERRALIGGSYEF